MRTIIIDMRQMRKWQVDQDNIKYFDTIMSNNGTFHTLDNRPYIELLTEFGINFTTGVIE